MKLSQALKLSFQKDSSLQKSLDSMQLANDFELQGISPLESALNCHISYIDQDKYVDKLSTSNAGAVLIRENLAKFVPNHIQAIVVENPHLAFAFISHLFAKAEFENPQINYANEHKNITIFQNVFIGKNVSIGEGSVIMPNVCISDNVRIGKGCKIYPSVTIYRDSVIGDFVNIHAGSVIGCDGFGYAHTKNGEHIKIEHNGKVIIESSVEIGSNVSIDRAVFGETIIKSGAKIDNLVQIGHNCEVGVNSILVSQVGLAGSTTMGRNVIMGGQAGTGGHIHIGDFVTIAGRGAVGKNLAPNTKWGGHPLMELDEWMKFYVNLRRMLKGKKKD